MQYDELSLAGELARMQQQASGEVVSFDEMFAAAERQVSRRRAQRLGGGFATATAAAIAALLFWAPNQLSTEAPPAQFSYVSVEALVSTTSWTAPSDSLLPQHQFDIYRDMPELFKSTKPDGGTLL